MAKKSATNESIEKELKEAREQLRRERDERTKKEGELKREREEKARERDEMEKERSEWKRIKLDTTAKAEELAKNLEKERENSMKKDAELARLRKLTCGKIGFVDEGRMEWKVKVEEISGDDYIYSPYSTYGGVPFRVSCITETISGDKYLSIYLYCNDRASMKTWSAKVVYTLTLKSSVESKFYKATDLFSASDDNLGYESFISWAEAVSPSQGYINDGHLTIEAHIKLIWFYKNSIANFSSPDEQISDVILLVGGKEFHVGKNYLCHFAEYFKALFLSDFAEKNKKSIELPEIDAKEFEELLKIIHPQREQAKVTKDNVEYLLRLADFFDIPFVVWQCIDFLKDDSGFSLTSKLLLTEQYRLPELQNHLLESMNNASDCQRAVNSPDFGELTDKMQKFLLEKYFKLSSE